VDLGPPIAYAALDPGTPVYSADAQQIGQVAHVLADEGEDIFDGIVIAEGPGHRAHRFADAEQIAEIHDRGVVLTLDRDACAQLPQPSANPAVMHDDPAQAGRGVRHEKLRRAWDLISGNY
jgi:uncharacterized protein YrrD